MVLERLLVFEMRLYLSLGLRMVNQMTREGAHGQVMQIMRAVIKMVNATVRAKANMQVVQAC